MFAHTTSIAGKWLRWTKDITAMTLSLVTVEVSTQEEKLLPVFTLETNDLCLGSDPTVTEETGKKKKISSLVFASFRPNLVAVKVAVCSNVNPLCCRGLGLVRWKGKAARWALKGESLLWNFDWMKCQKHSLAARHSMKEHWKWINYITVMHL